MKIAKNGAVKTAKEPTAIREVRPPTDSGLYVTKTVKLNDPNLSAMAELDLTIVGTTPLIVNHPEKKMMRMLETQMGAAKGKKPPKNPEQDFLEALICIGPEPKTMEEAQSGSVKYGVPAIWWKCLAVRSGYLSGFKMTDLRASLFVPPTHGTLVELLHEQPPSLRADQVRNSGGVADVRIRAQFVDWSVKITVIYNARIMSAEQLTSFYETGGVCNGVGEWRPFGRSSTGTFGCFKVTEAQARVPKILA